NIFSWGLKGKIFVDCHTYF
uniref:Uncharacterized protein n=1 Tax=Amphimedon queenslandica TaxID=400682 RepID=A0A1X7TZ82_AMPQE